MSEFDKVRIAELELELKQLKEKPIKKKVKSEKELYKLNKKEQSDLIIELGGKKIPRYEKDRVKMILELQ